MLSQTISNTRALTADNTAAQMAIDDIQADYQRLLSYYAQGISDPMRNQQLDHLRMRLYRIRANHVMDTVISRSSHLRIARDHSQSRPVTFDDMRRQLDAHISAMALFSLEQDENSSRHQAEHARNHYEQLSRIFDALTVMPCLSGSESATLAGIIASPLT